MILARKIAEGVGGWLQFEYACGRSGLFSERYLSVAIAQILSATFGGRVQSEFEHPILTPLMSGAGRRPSIDFVYCKDYPIISVAVETKWAGSSHTTVENIIGDLIRLEQVAYHHSATSLFLLAGQRSELSRLFSSIHFLGKSGAFEGGPILRLDSKVRHIFPLVPKHPYRIPLLRKIFRTMQNVPIPHSIETVCAKPFPAEVPKNQFKSMCGGSDRRRRG